VQAKRVGEDVENEEKQACYSQLATCHQSTLPSILHTTRFEIYKRKENQLVQLIAANSISFLRLIIQ